MKRIFLRSVAIGRVYTREHDLTPARFDMLVAIARGENGVVQRDMRAQLGVRSPTVSRMLTSLEELGYVQRWIYPPDHRHRWITLTPRGRQLIDGAQDEITIGGYGEEAARAMVSRETGRRRPTEKALAGARTLFATIRERTRDTATLRYPSHLPSGERMPQYPVPYADDRRARRSRGGRAAAPAPATAPL